MAIKPDDCILQLDKIRTLDYTANHWTGVATREYVYPKFWQNFKKHAFDTADWSSPSSARRDQYESNIKILLLKYKAEYKRKGNKEWVKFETEEDLLYFKMMWL